MTKTAITQITDDLDGSKDATEVAFSFDGVDYTIDLSKKNPKMHDAVPVIRAPRHGLMVRSRPHAAD